MIDMLWCLWMVLCTCNVAWHYMNIYLAYGTYYCKEMYGQVKYYTLFFVNIQLIIDIRIKQCTTKQGTTHHCRDWCFLHVGPGVDLDAWARHPKRQPSILTCLWAHFSTNKLVCLICVVLFCFKQTMVHFRWSKVIHNDISPKQNLP